MVIESYSFALPLDLSQCLKVTFQVLEKQKLSFKNSHLPINLTYKHTTEKKFYLNCFQELTGNIINSIKQIMKHTPILSMSISFKAYTSIFFNMRNLKKVVDFELHPVKKLIHFCFT